MRRRESEYVQEFSEIFMKIYNAIPTQFKPPPSSSQLLYVEAFDSEFTLWLSEIKLTSLVDMMRKGEKREIEGRIKSPNNLLPLTHKRP